MMEVVVSGVTKNGKAEMNTAASVAARLVTREETRTRSRMLAYRAVASKVGRSADWLRKLLRDGSGVVTDEIKQRLDEMLLRGLEADFERTQTELELARQCSTHIASRHVDEIEAHLSRVKKLLNGGE